MTTHHNRPLRLPTGRDNSATVPRLSLLVRRLAGAAGSPSTTCQIEFRNGTIRRTIYRHWDGYPAAVMPDLLAFLAWSKDPGHVECESANFIHWSKRHMDEEDQQLGLGICANDELHSDIEYYYVVDYRRAHTSVRAYAVTSEKRSRIGRCVQRVVVPEVTRRPPAFSSSLAATAPF